MLCRQKLEFYHFISVIQWEEIELLKYEVIAEITKQPIKLIQSCKTNELTHHVYLDFHF